MNIITLVLDWLYKIFYGLNGLDLIIIAILLALFYNWAFNRGYGARELDEQEERQAQRASWRRRQ